MSEDSLDSCWTQHSEDRTRLFCTPHRSARNSQPSFSVQWPSSTLDLSNSVSLSFAWIFWCPLNPQTVTIYHRHLVHKHGLSCPSIFRLFWSTYLTWYFMILHACHNFLVPAAHRSAALWDSCASTTKPNCLERPCKLHKGYLTGIWKKGTQNGIQKDITWITKTIFQTSHGVWHRSSSTASKSCCRTSFSPRKRWRTEDELREFLRRLWTSFIHDVNGLCRVNAVQWKSGKVFQQFEFIVRTYMGPNWFCLCLSSLGWVVFFSLSPLNCWHWILPFLSSPSCHYFFNDVFRHIIETPSKYHFIIIIDF